MACLALPILVLADLITLWGQLFWIQFTGALILYAIGVSARRLTLYKIKGDIADTCGARRSPHVIAHSFGTWLSCWALHDFDDVSYRRIILAGCVLPRRFSWSKILHKKPQAFVEVRNETGLRDWVVMLAASLGTLVGRVGAAGARGFIGKDDFVHERRTWRECKACSAEDSNARVHNILLPGNSHWISLLQAGHAAKIWLPYLWGYEPSEYHDYNELCEKGARAVDDNHVPTMLDVEATFRKHAWTWTDGMTTELYLAQLATKYLNARGKQLRPDESARIVRDAVYSIWVTADEGNRESAQPIGKRNESVARFANPGWAFIETIGAITKDYE